MEQCCGLTSPVSYTCRMNGLTASITQDILLIYHSFFCHKGDKLLVLMITKDLYYLYF